MCHLTSPDFMWLHLTSSDFTSAKSRKRLCSQNCRVSTTSWHPNWNFKMLSTGHGFMEVFLEFVMCCYRAQSLAAEVPGEQGFNDHFGEVDGDARQRIVPWPVANQKVVGTPQLSTKIRLLPKSWKAKYDLLLVPFRNEALINPLQLLSCNCTIDLQYNSGLAAKHLLYILGKQISGFQKFEMVRKEIEHLPQGHNRLRPYGMQSWPKKIGSPTVIQQWSN